MLEAGGTFQGAIQGGGGGLEITGVAGTITRLGSGPTISGFSGAFSGFGSYILDAAGWVIAGTETLTAGQTLTVAGAPIVSGALTNLGTVTASAGVASKTGVGKAGGNALALAASGSLNNSGQVIGGAGGASGYYNYVSFAGGAGGAGVLAGNAGAIITNSGTVRGGLGGLGGPVFTGGNGGGGGAGVAGGAPVTIANSGLLMGGTGGVGGYNPGSTGYGTGGVGGLGGAGVSLAAGGLITNSGRIAGGTGGAGGQRGASSGKHGGNGGVGGSGVVMTTGGSLANTGTVSGGAGGAAGAGGGDAAGIAGDGVVLTAGGSLTNGSATVTAAAITGYIGVYAGPGGGATVINFATISGTSASVKFASSSDRLILQGGAKLNGLAQGAGGTLELAGGAGTIVGLGATGALTGSDSATFTGFGAYQIDAATSWTLSGANAIAAGKTLANAGTIIGGVTLTSSSARLIAQSGSSITGAVGGGGGTLELASGTGAIAGLGAIGTISIAEALTFSGFGTYQIDAGGVWTLTGTNTVGAGKTLINAGTLVGGIALTSPSARLILQTGGSFVGAVVGGGGTLELAPGSGMISGLGTSFTGFGSYLIDSGGSWTLNGTNAIPTGKTLINAGTLANAGAFSGGLTLTSSSARLIAEGGSSIAGKVAGGGGALELASGAGTISGLGATGTLSGGDAMTFSGFGSYLIDAGSIWTLAGANTMAAGVTLANAGTLDITGSIVATTGASAPSGVGSSGVDLLAGGAITLSGSIEGGAGLYVGYGSVGGTGGAGISGSATGTITSNAGVIAGGAGGMGDYGGLGGTGGIGVSLGSGSVTINGGSVTGGTGGEGSEVNDRGGNGGAGGAGVVLAVAGAINITAGVVTGGTGGAGGSVYYGGGNGGIGGDGVVLSGPGVLANIAGTIVGGFGGAGGSAGPYQTAGSSGRAGDGVLIAAGGVVTNGGAASSTALIEGLVGVYAGSGGATTVTNWGTIDGTGGVSVQFGSASDRLIAEAGSTWTGSVQGGGGTLELASGTGNIAGLGAMGTISGAETMTFSGFDTYQLDAGTSWTFSGSDALTAGKTLVNDGTINNGVVLTSSGARLIAQGGSDINGAVAGGDGTLELASGTGTISGLGATGTVSGSEALTFSGFGIYQVDAGSAWTLNGTNIVAAGQSLENAGTLINAGALDGGVTLTSSNARLIDDGGSTISGTISGDGGTLELASGTGTISGLGTVFTGFGSYIVDPGGSWTLAGTNTIAGTKTLADAGTLISVGTLTGGVTLTAPSARLVAQMGSSISGLVAGHGGTLELASGTGTITGMGATGTISVAEGITFSGFGAYQIDAASVWTLNGTDAVVAGKTLVNAGTLHGGVKLTASSARLVASNGSRITGAVAGGGGTLELASGSGTITGLGVKGSISGSDAMSFSGFGTYQFDAGSAWTLSGTNTLAANQTVTNFGSLAGALTLGSSTDRLVLGAGSTTTGVVAGGGGVLELASATGTVTGLGGAATLTGAQSLTFSGFGSYVLDSGAWTLAGANGLSASQTLSNAAALTVAGSLSNQGLITQSAGAAGGGAGGTGVILNAGASVGNSGTIRAGAGGAGGTVAYSGAGGLGADLTAAGTLINSGLIAGGAGGGGVNKYFATGFGGTGVSLIAGVLSNTGTILGGAGASNANFGGQGGIGLIDQVAGSSANGGTIIGGQGGGGASGGSGGGGVLMTASGIFTNSGTVKGGHGGANGGRGGFGFGEFVGDAATLINHGLVQGGAGGSASSGGYGACGAGMYHGGSVINYGTIVGGLAGNGSGLEANGVYLLGGASVTNRAGGLIVGDVGVGAGAGAALSTVTNYGTIEGLNFGSVLFQSASDRLIAEAGSALIGLARGGGGTLELASASGMVTGLGSTGTVSVSESMTFSGFGSYVFDAGGSWTFSGTNILGANQTLTDAGTINGALSLGDASARLILDGGATFSGSATGGGGTLELASGVGSVSGFGTTFSGFSAYAIDAGGAWTVYGNNALSSGQNVVVSGALNLAGTLSNSGVIQGVAGVAGAYGLHDVGYPGGAGATALAIVSTSASLTNTGTISGGVGGKGGQAAIYGGGGGSGGAAVAISDGGSITNSGGSIVGGEGGQGGYSPEYAGGGGGEGGAGITLSAAGSVEITSGVINGGAGGAGNDFFFGASGGAGGAGVGLGNGGSVTLTGGTITGGAGGVGSYGYDNGGSGGNGGTGVALAAGGTVTNTGGAIFGGAGAAGGYGYFGGAGGGAGGAGVLLSSGGAVSNTTGMIVGGSGGAGGGRNNGPSAPAGPAGDGVAITAGGIVVNGSTASTAALIEGLVGVYAGSGGAATVTSFGTIDGTGGVSVQFKSASDRLIAEAGSTWVGSAQGGGGTLELAGGTGTITGLGATGVIFGAEAMTFSGFGTYQLDAGGSWTLTGTNTLAAGDNLSVAGALTIAGTVTNAGTITGLAGSALTLKRADIIGGALQSATVIRVTLSGNILDGTTGTLTNQASVLVTNMAALTLQGNIVNSGKISLGVSTATTSLIVGSAGATLSGHGSILLGASAFNTLTGATTASKLTNVDNTLSGSGLIGNGKLVLNNQAAGVIDQTGTVAMTINTGTRTIINAGTIEATGTGGATIASAVTNTGLLEAVKGNLTVNAAVTGTGSAVINAGTMTFASTFVENVSFSGTTGELVLAQSQTYSGKISGFSKTGGTSLDLRDIGFVSASEATFSGTRAGGVLTVTDGTHTAKINITGNYLSSTWTCSSDGAGGVIVVDPTPPQAPSANAFTAAMAGLGASAASAAAGSAAVEPVRPTLLVPRGA